MRRAFTLIELISTTTIVAVLVALALFFVGSYITSAQQIADQRTLAVLNDALTRYKCEGGDLNALTVGAPIKNVLARLTSPINWNGLQHQVMQTGQTYPARSLSATGMRQTYQFTKYNTYGAPVDLGADILSRLSAQGTPADNTYQVWLASTVKTMGDGTPFLILKQPSSQLSIGFTIGTANSADKVEINWGDGNTATYTNGTTGTTYTHTYSSAGTYGVTMMGKITSFSSWYSDGKTAFGGDVSTATSLTYLSAGYSNTLSGSIAGLTNLTWVDLGGSNTISGSVAGLTKLTYLVVGGSNTITGWEDAAANAKGLCYMYQGGNTVLTPAQVNKVLAGFLANSALSHTANTYRLINMTRFGNGAPTGQGIVDKATLQSTVTPGGDGRVWSVSTN